MWLTGGAIAVLRLIMLALRLALTLYVTGGLGLAVMGQFGLILGAAALAPALIGMGLNLYMCRDVVGSDPADKIAVVRDRMRYTIRVLTLSTALAAAIYWSVVGAPSVTVLLVLAVLWGEALAVDAYLALTGLRLNVLANISVALRTAGWIPAAILLGLISEEFRNLDTVLSCWLGGHIANGAMLGVILRRRGWLSRWRGDAPTGWATRTLPNGLRIWPSDIALVLIAFGDRFVLSTFVGDAALGIFVFYATFANAASSLVQSAIVAPALPRLIAHYWDGGREWMVQIRRIGGIAIGLASALAIGLLAAMAVAHVLLPRSAVPWHPGLAALVVAVTLARFAGDYLSTALNSAGAVTDYARLNMGFAAALMAAMTIGAAIGGMMTALIAAFAAALCFDVLKFRALSRLAASTRPALA